MISAEYNVICKTNSNCKKRYIIIMVKNKRFFSNWPSSNRFIFSEEKFFILICDDCLMFPSSIVIHGNSNDHCQLYRLHLLGTDLSSNSFPWPGGHFNALFPSAFHRYSLIYAIDLSTHPMVWYTDHRTMPFECYAIRNYKSGMCNKTTVR